MQWEASIKKYFLLPLGVLMRENLVTTAAKETPLLRALTNIDGARAQVLAVIYMNYCGLRRRF